jgi:FAD/FMN-containing dehydrogenase
MQQIEPSVLDELQSKLASAGIALIDPLTTGDATRRWNGALRTDPSLIASCETAEQVSLALRLVREADQPVTILSGGQDWTGRALREGCVVLDLSAMNTISIDTTLREAVIGGGVTAGQLNAAAAGHHLAAAVGNDGAVGMVGLLMGGGYGPLMTRFGLACDSLLSAPGRASGRQDRVLRS